MQDTEIDNLPEPRKLIIKKPDTFFLINPEASKIPTSDDALPEKFHHQQIATLKYLLTFNSSCRNLGGPGAVTRNFRRHQIFKAHKYKAIYRMEGA
ncbi:hypothetical protein CEXT_177701 [Caerostris extrusa]|uniref:Uncharacterized protein n=1 Tax=Caerostris extrusa TaxID=172846 RepID=A0AAV4QZZ2_CAEEX|nr:hypothetical protein CEXT_177701 [Caerostris extrusa]